jgi:protein-L-isoaspartate(D-aspartate) O-methyltransferase
VALSLLFPRATVIGVEHIKELVENSIKNVNKRYGHLIESGRLKIYLGDGLKGMKSEAPFDYIHSGASKLIKDKFILKIFSPFLAFKHVSYKLFNQVKNGGRFVTPVSSPKDEERQFIWVFDKNRKGFITGVKTIKESYVFMQSAKKQLKNGKDNIFMK